MLTVVFNVRLAFFDHERPDQPPVDLEADMAVVDIAASRIGYEIVRERLTRRDRLLRQPGHSVHLVRHRDPVPVDRGVFRQLVLYHDPQPIALLCTDLGTGKAIVVEPGAVDLPWTDLDFPESSDQLHVPDSPSLLWAARRVRGRRKTLRSRRLLSLAPASRK